MRRVVLGAVLFVIGLMVVASVYGVYNQLYLPATLNSASPTPNPTQSPTPTQKPVQQTPTPTDSPNPTAAPTPSQVTLPSGIVPTPSAITITDVTGANVTVDLPVRRIICLTMIELVHVLGAGDKVVGYSASLSSEAKAILPSSVLMLPDVGTDMAPNLERILELQPNLVLASQRLSDANRKKLEDAGIAVVEDTLTGDRRNVCIRNLGLLLGAELKAEEFITYEQYYINLVKTRVATLTRSQKPLVYFEWYKPWFSTGPGDSYNKMMVDAGGINIAENATVVNPELSPEYVAEQNPDIVIRMSTYLDGDDLAALQTLRNSILTQPALSETKAVKEGKVYIIKSTLLVDRDVIGLLYFAKWFHPSLFSDIDPAAVHAEYIQRFFGATLTGVFVYP